MNRTSDFRLRVARRVAPVALAAGALLVAGPTNAEAQAHRYGAGWTAGASYLTDLNPSTSARSLSPGAGFVLGLHVDRWYGADGRIGVRYQGSYQQPRFDWSPGRRSIDAVGADVSALYRLMDPAEEGPALPYLTAGLGAVWYDLGTGPDTFFPEADAFHDGGSRLLPLVSFGVGADVRSPWNWDTFPVRLRVEVADHMTFGSPLRRASDGSRYGPVHHLRFTVGAYSAIDLFR